jgi:pyruvate carboxylase
LNRKLAPVAQYLDIEGIVQICKDAKVTAVHPGYGFLSENEKFAAALEAAGITL